MPTRFHPRVAPFPLSRLAFTGPVRPTLPAPSLLASLTAYLNAGGNVVELPRGLQREVAERVRLWVEERRGVEAGAGGADVLYVVSVGWRDVVQFIEERRVEWREQQRVEEQLSYRRRRREQIKQQNIAAQQQEAQQQQPLDSSTPTPPTDNPLSQSTDQPLIEADGGETKAAVEEEEDELLPINRLDLCQSDTPIDFTTIDIFPYLHAHLTAVSHIASLPHLPLVLLDDVDLVPAEVRDEYVSRWSVALEQCVLARRIHRYGVTSAQFTSGGLPLQRCVETAAGILDEPHFAAIRFPFNVYDTRALTERCCDNDGTEAATVAQYAARHGLLCIADAGVDVVDRKGNEHRLVSASSAVGGEDSVDGKKIAEQLKGAFNVALFMEKRLQQLMADREDELAAIGVSKMDLSWAHIMAAQLSLLDNAVRWDRLLHDTIQPTLHRALHSLSAHVSQPPGPTGAQEWEHWCRDYRQATTVLFSTFTASLAHASENHAATVAAWLDTECAELTGLSGLEQRVVLLSLCSGVDVVGTSEVQRVVDLLEVGWKDEKVRTGSRDGAKADERWPERWLSRERALQVMKTHDEKHS